jgi:ferredoxin, 2Fe-2S
MGLAIFVLKDGTLRSEQIPDGTSLAEHARNNDVPGILAECGCNLACATCHVYVVEPWLAALPPPTDIEAEMIEGAAAATTPESRLACQLIMSKDLDGITVKIPDEQ